LTDVVLELATGYPDDDVEATAQDLHRALEIALSTLVPRAWGVAVQHHRPWQARQEGEEANASGIGVVGVWKAIRGDAEADFAPALKEVPRLKVVYVASKFMNNRAVGTAITEAALAIAQEQEVKDV